MWKSNRSLVNVIYKVCLQRQGCGLDSKLTRWIKAPGPSSLSQLSLTPQRWKCQLLVCLICASARKSWPTAADHQARVSFPSSSKKRWVTLVTCGVEQFFFYCCWSRKTIKMVISQGKKTYFVRSFQEYSRINSKSVLNMFPLLLKKIYVPASLLLIIIFKWFLLFARYVAPWLISSQLENGLVSTLAVTFALNMQS